ncbi:hypothetical protein M4951_08205 [Blastopirellula sp. J2-11]|uniref:hypothetical protein n=1 Tax=Blastopirellula sp. J2-11 TaxID=2943192 RepID=UPI0021C5CAA1|nr:hypothetical protein [Blastopirellula sp. J2-11]UUO08291.1 hypothetical protein M4951_08205 [Blastopirellula sp. J2-11]
MHLSTHDGWFWLTSLLAAMTVIGCGAPAAPGVYAVEGSVTYDGKPVPGGRITFSPNASLGNKGPGSYAKIANGRFTTPSGKGVVGGPYVVEITGYDVSAPHYNVNIDSEVIFSNHQIEVEFPESDSVQSFEVPRKGRKGK